MSSLPSPEGVTRLRTVSKTYRLLDEEIELLKKEIVEKTKRLAKALEEHQENKKAMIKQLESMDCKASGNFGYEERMAWMLSEFATQIIKEKKEDTSSIEVAA